MNKLFADGGVIGKNPSPTGGTWAYCIPEFENAQNNYFGAAGILTLYYAPEKIIPVTNNQTEMLAILKGFDALPENWIGTIYSDSMVTIGRIKNGKKGLQVGGWEWKNIPAWMYMRYNYHRKRFLNFKDFQYVQLDGHPTKAQLESGIGKRGNPTHKYNVWCDEKCGEIGKVFLETGKRIIVYSEE